MTRELTFLWFSAFLLVQCCQHIAAQEPVLPNLSEEPPLEIEQMITRNELLDFTRSEFTVLNAFALVEGKNILNNVLTDPDILKAPNEELQRHLNNLTKYVQKVDALQRTSGETEYLNTLFQLVRDSVEIWNKYNAGGEERPLTVEEQRLGESLQKNHLDEMRERISERYLEFFEKFHILVTKYFDTLSTTTERENERQMINWYEKLEIEKNIVEQLALFNEFPSFF